MGIGSVKVPEGAAVRQSKAAVQGAAARQNKGADDQQAVRQADVVSKNIQDEISEVQRQKQGLSSKQEMSAEERSKAKQELQHELSSLNTRLRQRQAKISREQKNEARLEEMAAQDADRKKNRTAAEDTGRAALEKAGPGSETEEKNNAEKSTEVKGEEEKAENLGAAEGKAGQDKEEKLNDFDIPQDKMQTIVAGGFSKEQVNRRDAVIARMEGGIVILKGEIRQDEIRGDDTEKKKAELKARETRVRNAAKGLPAVSVPFEKADVALRKAGRAKSEADNGLKTGIVKRSPDGVVVIT